MTGFCLIYWKLLPYIKHNVTVSRMDAANEYRPGGPGKPLR
jgi:hypothetical protein